MLAKCANPACSTAFRYLENGTLFRLENDPWCASHTRVREYFWLCRGCSAALRLQLDDHGEIRVAPIGHPPRCGEDGIDFVLLERQNGMLLSRITFLNPRVRRREKTEGGQLQL
jgi:hypothetical protein